MKYSITVKHEWSSGHRIFPYEGRCQRPHGHNYRAFVTVGTAALDENDMVADFTTVRDVSISWIDDNWDHAFILNSEDVTLRDALAAVPESRVFLLEARKPTAEVLAMTLGQQLTVAGLSVLSTEVWETERQFARVDFSM